MLLSQASRRLAITASVRSLSTVTRSSRLPALAAAYRSSPLFAASTSLIEANRRMQRSLATAVAEPIPFDNAHAPSPFVTDSPSPLDKPLPGYRVVSGGHNDYAVFQHDLIKSPNDDRQYRLVLLKNGMEALIVHDPKTDKSAAAMDVKVGHLSDPEDLQGLAHFCEHLMFMGTEKVRCHVLAGTKRLTS